MNFWKKIKQRYLRQAPRYQPSFTKTAHGNGINFGKPLDVKIRGAEVLTARIYNKQTKKTYQIDQSHSNDKDKNAETIQLSMKSKLHPDAKAPHYYLPPGKYTLLVWWWDDDIMRGGTYRDNFVIIP